ncbi:MAG TPA: HAD hydrolase family protein [Flavobacterium sp.]|jgi:3-deoxy-D-manno-octulosonate 8-phosphate phosphatase (KDO 8-P phosphatase)
MESYKVLMNTITTFVFDLDGVLTDNTVQVTAEGELLRTISIRDSFAIKHAVENGYRVCIISEGNNEGIRIIFTDLDVDDIHFNVKDKVRVFNQLVDQYQFKPGEVLCMGDDMPDYQVMKLCGIAACPQDAAPEIKLISNYVSHKNGGHGAVRDVIEQVLKVQGKWMSKFNSTNTTNL